MRSAVADMILRDTPARVKDNVRQYGRQRMRSLLCHMLKAKGKQHPATRTVINNLLPKPSTQ